MNMKTAIKWVVYGALFLIPFLPLYVGNSFFFPFITGKNFAFRILVEIALVGWALLALVDARYRPKFSWTFALFTALVVWMAIADVFAVNPAKAFWSNFERMDGWVTLIHVYAFFVVSACVLTADKLWRKWWLTFLGVAGLICLYSVFQINGALAIHQGGVRVDATFGNAAYLAAYLSFGIAIALWQAFESEKKWLRYSSLVLAALEVLILFYTATRGAILGVTGAAIFGSILWMFEAGKKSRRAAGGTLLVLLVLVGGFMLVKNQTWIRNEPTLGRLASISLSDPETHTRFTIWSMALEGFMERPVTGWGQDGFNYVFNKYYKPSLFGQEPWFDRAHDIYLDWLVAGGAPALLLFLALLISTTIALYRSNVSRSERILLISALAAYAFQGLFVFDNLFSYIPLAALLALAHAASSRPIPSVQNVKEISDSDASMIGLPIALVALVLILWFVNVPSIRAATDLIAAITPSSDVNQNIAAFKQAYADGSFADQEITEQLATYMTNTVGNPSVSNADKITLATYTMQQLQTLVQRIPNDARVRLEYVLALRAVGQYDEAIKQIKIAQTLSPHKQGILIEEGIDEWQAKDYPAARAAFYSAYQLDPSFGDVAVYAAAGDVLTHNIPAAKALLMQKFGTSVVPQDALVFAYYQIGDYPDLIALLRQKVINNGNQASDEFTLAGAMAKAGDIAGARAQIQQTIKEHPEAASEGASLLSQISANSK